MKKRPETVQDCINNMRIYEFFNDQQLQDLQLAICYLNHLTFLSDSERQRFESLRKHVFEVTVTASVSESSVSIFESIERLDASIRTQRPLKGDAR